MSEVIAFDATGQTRKACLLRDDAAIFQTGKMVKDRYQLLEVVGVGGSSIVFKALDTWRMSEEEMFRIVAIKTLRKEWVGAREAENALLFEAELLQRIAHPGVVRAFHVDRESDIPFLVMEWIKGVSLEQHLRDEYPNGMPLSTAEALCEQIATTLTDLHAQGVTHGDLKPANCILRKDGTIAIVDFGLAYTEALGVPPVRLRGGSPDYLSPAQKAGQLATQQNDRYAVLKMWLCAVVGSPSLEQDSIGQLSARHQGWIRSALSRLGDGRELSQKFVTKGPFMSAAIRNLMVGQFRCMGQNTNSDGGEGRLDQGLPVRIVSLGILWFLLGVTVASPVSLHTLLS